MTTFQSGQPISFEAGFPTRDRGRAAMHTVLDVAIALACAQYQDEARSEHVPGWQSSGLSPTFQFLFLFCS